MNFGDLDNIKECYNCEVAYFEHDGLTKCLRNEFLCKRCKKEKED